MNNNMVLVLMLALFSGCSTVKSDRTRQPADRTLQPIDCTTSAKREECLAVANMDKKVQKKTAKPTQPDQRVRPAKVVESKKINDEKAKVKSEVPSLAQDDKVETQPDLKTQKKIDGDQREQAFSASMDCVRSNMRKKDDVRSPVRAVAYELALLCRKKGVQVDSIANATVPLIEQSRAPKKTK